MTEPSDIILNSHFYKGNVLETKDRQPSPKENGTKEDLIVKKKRKKACSKTEIPGNSIGSVKASVALTSSIPLITLEFPITKTGLLFKNDLYWDINDTTLPTKEQFAASIREDFDLPLEVEKMILLQMKKQLLAWSKSRPKPHSSKTQHSLAKMNKDIHSSTVPTHSSTVTPKPSLSFTSIPHSHLQNIFKDMAQRALTKTKWEVPQFVKERICHFCRSKVNSCRSYCHFASHSICETDLVKAFGIQVQDHSPLQCRVCTMRCNCQPCLDRRKRRAIKIYQQQQEKHSLSMENFSKTKNHRPTGSSTSSLATSKRSKTLIINPKIGKKDSKAIQGTTPTTKGTLTINNKIKTTNKPTAIVGTTLKNTTCPSFYQKKTTTGQTGQSTIVGNSILQKGGTATKMEMIIGKSETIRNMFNRMHCGVQECKICTLLIPVNATSCGYCLNPVHSSSFSVPDFASDKMKYCFICLSHQSLLYCRICPRAFHRKCLEERSCPSAPSGVCYQCRFQTDNRTIANFIEKNLILESGKWKEACKQLLQFLCHHDFAGPFLFPILPHQVPQYTNTITSPMDLSSIQNKLNSNPGYNSIQEVVNSVQKVWSNCKEFNAEHSAVVLMADTLSEIFNRVVSYIQRHPTFTEAFV